MLGSGCKTKATKPRRLDGIPQVRLLGPLNGEYMATHSHTVFYSAMLGQQRQSRVHTP